MSLAGAPSLKSGRDGHDDRSMPEDGSYDSSTPRALGGLTEAECEVVDGKRHGKGKRRSLFGFGKKKAEASCKPGCGMETPPLSKEGSKPSSVHDRPAPSTRHTNGSRAELGPPLSHPSSPVRGLSYSPRVPSPASSQIFERDVQDGTVLKPSSPAIPTHIRTDNYIPPVLDDASEAITNRKLDPDAVEIVTHTSHQPASVTVAGMVTASSPCEQTSSEWAAELASFADRVGLSPDNASNYGSLDSADVRRLSFISFADVVQAEHSTGHAATFGSRESIHMAGLTSIPSALLNRSPSPIRSPVSSQEPGTSPPTSNPGSVLGVDASPPRKHAAVGACGGGGGHANLATSNDLSIETMRQALRRTGSTDLSNFRTFTGSAPTSMPASPIDGPAPH
ncbi:hypothetical protein DCS_01711 [Drechmeria coniospora]|uniref:Uncharacterized protein n=1 Tax=Drechmeria coniospora TaxID=98403 RepID=A0A151GTX5_DRECN|nr:hypothetical protein DCS_01711 [Drechmeria coniospora]KYK60574.1 hypothetical protein DCS_01711 [Drechmeria coniospora]ODA80730.1 hypothetical protein RJ55_03689 [Drechmeria coniospora]